MLADYVLKEARDETDSFVGVDFGQYMCEGENFLLELVKLVPVMSVLRSAA